MEQAKQQMWLPGCSEGQKAEQTHQHSPVQLALPGATEQQLIGNIAEAIAKVALALTEASDERTS